MRAKSQPDLPNPRRRDGPGLAAIKRVHRRLAGLGGLKQIALLCRLLAVGERTTALPTTVKSDKRQRRMDTARCQHDVSQLFYRLSIEACPSR